MAPRTPPTKGPGPEPGSGSGWAAGPDPGTGGKDGLGASAHQDAPLNSAVDPIPTVVRISPAPFVWQHDRQLLLLDREPLDWVLAELRFDAARCRYVEVQRARYRWPREAVGALLARGGAASDAAAERLADDLLRWAAERGGDGDSATA